MKPRAIVFDLFGDHLRYLGGEARLRALTELLELFGIGESTTRVVLSRMRREGWFETRREGRQTVYALSARAWHLLDEGRVRIFDRVGESWDGEWRMVVYEVPEGDRVERQHVRTTLAWHGFGRLGPATWVSPHPRLDDVADALADRPTPRLHLLTCRTRGPQADRELAARCWDLDGLNRAYAEFAAKHERELRSRTPDRLPGREALVARVELVHAYRKFPFLDPDLPAKLLPQDWSGQAAHDLFVAAHDALGGPADSLVREIVGGAAGSD